MLATKNESIKIEYTELKRLSQDKEKRMEYEARQKDIRDHNYLINQAKREGKQEGIQQEKISNARNFLSMGLSIEQVAKGTELSYEEIKQIQKDLNIS